MRHSSVKDEAPLPGLTARRLAVDLVEGVIHRHQTLDVLSPQIDSTEQAQEDRAFSLTLTLTSLRHFGSLRALVQARLSKALPAQARRIEIILIIAVAQLLILKTPAHAVVSLSVELAKENSATLPFAPLVNAVLRRISEDKTLVLDSGLNLPEWLFNRWKHNYGEHTALNMSKALLVEPPLDLSIKSNVEDWVKKLKGQVLATGTLRLSAHKGSIVNLSGYEEGAWWVQDAGAFLPVLACGDVNNKRVLDLCAAPGGKTAALAARGAHVTAVDRSKPRLDLLQQNMRRLHFNVETICADVTKWEPKKEYEVILLDAPCSSTGTLRRHPDVAWIKSEKDIEKLAALQFTLLKRAVKWLKPDGLLVYATCSLEPEEGERQIERILEKESNLKLFPLTAAEAGGLAEVTTANGVWRTRPDMLVNEGGVDGFFIGRFTV
jgi:16S rRNA (cytosine967-C5)-methyltransferase